MVLVCPSVLSADFTCLGEDCARVLNAGADMIHFDVMDGHFVDNLSFGLPVLETLHHALPQAVMDVHLMISHPLRFVHRFAEAGADRLGADGLADGAALLVPFPFDGMYPHYLCAMIDAALGENDRYAGAMTRCNAILGEFAAWLRRSCPPPVRRMRW